MAANCEQSEMRGKCEDKGKDKPEVRKGSEKIGEREKGNEGRMKCKRREGNGHICGKERRGVYRDGREGVAES